MASIKRIFTLKRIVSFIVVVILGTGVWYAFATAHPKTELAAISEEPQGYLGDVVGLRVIKAREAEPILGYETWQVTDDGETWLPLIGEKPGSAGTNALWAKVHQPVIQGRGYVVLEQTAKPNAPAWPRVAQRLREPIKPVEPVVLPKQAPQESFAGRVIDETSILGINAFTIRIKGGKTLAVASADTSAPKGAQVCISARPVRGLDLDSGLALYEADRLISSLSSVNATPRAFTGRTISVQGQVVSGLTVMGKSAFKLTGEEGNEIVVLGNGGAPFPGESVIVTGQTRYLAGFGKAAWIVLGAREVAQATYTAAEQKPALARRNSSKSSKAIAKGSQSKPKA